MSNIGLSFKAVVCSSVACGIICSPFLYSSVDNSVGKLIPATTAKKRKSVELGSSTKGGISLNLKNISNIEKLFSGEKEKLNFEEIGMKFEGKDLKKEDILYSICQDGKYYLMKHYGGSTYKFEDGTSVKSCRKPSEYENLNYVNLNWTRYTYGSAQSPQITVGSCSLHKIPDKKANKDFKLQIQCSQFPNRNGIQVRGEFGEENYEYE